MKKKLISLNAMVLVFTVTRQLTNVRPSSDETPQLLTTPTPGNLRINQPASESLGVNNGDFLLVIEADNADGKGKRPWVAKGTAPVTKPDEKDPSKKITVDAAVGAKLATSTGKTGGNLTCSSMNAYEFLGGNTKSVRIFDVDSTDKVTHEGFTFFALNFKEEEAKTEKKKANATA